MQWRFTLLFPEKRHSEDEVDSKIMASNLRDIIKFSLESNYWTGIRCCRASPFLHHLPAALVQLCHKYSVTRSREPLGAPPEPPLELVEDGPTLPPSPHPLPILRHTQLWDLLAFRRAQTNRSLPAETPRRAPLCVSGRVGLTRVCSAVWAASEGERLAGTRGRGAGWRSSSPVWSATTHQQLGVQEVEQRLICSFPLGKLCACCSQQTYLADLCHLLSLQSDAVKEQQEETALWQSYPSPGCADL